MTRTFSSELLGLAALETRRGEVLMTVEAARRQELVGPSEAEALSARIEAAGSAEAIDAVPVPDADVSGLPRPDFDAWQEEVLTLLKSYLEPGAADWYAGMAQPNHLLVVWMCRDLALHARELRRRLSQPYRLRCAGAAVPLAPLRAVEESVWEEFEDAVNSSGIDFERNAVVVEADRDVTALAARLRKRFGELVIVEFGHAAQI